MKYKGFTYTPAPKTAWDNLSMQEKSEMMKVAVKNGITDLKTIREKYNEFAEGGEKESNNSKQPMPITTGGAGYIPPTVVLTDDDKLKLSADMMESVRQFRNLNRRNEKIYSNDGGTPQNTYLLDRDTQKRIFLKNGYTERPGDYGLVRKAVGNRNIPVYQQNPDAISRAELTPIGNINDKWFGELDKQLEHPGSFPTTIYRGIDGKFYQKAWDLNDYGGKGGSTAGILGNILDIIGSPTVVTTGFQPVKSFLRTSIDYNGKIYYDNSYKKLVDEMMAKKGLYPIKDTDLYGLPEITITGNKHRFGGNLFENGGGLTFEEVNNSIPALIVKTADPTGVTSWPDVISTGSDLYNNPTWENAGALGLEVFGALPIVGKIGKLGKLVKGTTKKIRAANRAKAAKAGITMGLIKSVGAAKDASDYNKTYNKKSYGGSLQGPIVDMANMYGGGGFLEWLKGLFSSEPEKKPRQYTYRGKPAEVIRAVYPNKQELKLAPKRQRPNTSKTKTDSERLERLMGLKMVDDAIQNGASKPIFDIPFIPEKAILINGSTTSTNVLDSLAKYAGIHNRNPQLSEHPRKKKGSYDVPRQINMNEMLGLSTQETHNGAMPYFNYKNGDVAYNRALGNTNYFTAFGYIPAENLVRNFQYNDANVDRNTPPLLDAFRYYAQGDYNTRNLNHTKDVNSAGKTAWQTPAVKDWWETSGKYWYKNGKGPK